MNWLAREDSKVGDFSIQICNRLLKQNSCRTFRLLFPAVEINLISDSVHWQWQSELDLACPCSRFRGHGRGRARGRAHVRGCARGRGRDHDRGCDRDQSSHPCPWSERDPRCRRSTWRFPYFLILLLNQTPVYPD